MWFMPFAAMLENMGSPSRGLVLLNIQLPLNGADDDHPVDTVGTVC